MSATDRLRDLTEEEQENRTDDKAFDAALTLEESALRMLIHEVLGDLFDQVEYTDLVNEMGDNIAEDGWDYDDWALRYARAWRAAKP